MGKASVIIGASPAVRSQSPGGSHVRLLEEDAGAGGRQLLSTLRPFAVFAVGVLLVFGAVGLALFAVIQGDLRQYEEGSAQTHAVFIADSIMRYQLQPADVAAPVTPERQAELTAVAKQRAILGPVVRVKVWSPALVVLYSDDPRIEGLSFNNAEVKEALEGRTVSEVEDQTAPENVYERNLAPKLYSTYVPIRLDSTPGPPQAVVEVYQRYDRIQAGIDQLSRDLSITLGVGLGALYLLLLPIVLTTLKVHADRARALREDQQKSRFLAFMGHELRTPLNAILGFADLLQGYGFENLTDRQVRHVANIRTAGRQLLGVINELLDFSRAEAGQLAVAHEKVDLAELAASVLEQLGPAADAAAIRLALEPVGELVASGDSVRVQQVLTNLVNNAIKFTPAGGSVAVHGRAAGGWVEVAVTDDGTGIPAQALEKVFEPYVRVESQAAGREGSGLGLSLSRKLVEAMGGTLRVESAVGVGSTFTMRLRQA